jgi:hypothetical protein
MMRWPVKLENNAFVRVGFVPIFDGEAGPEIYVGATKEAQAKRFGNRLSLLSIKARLVLETKREIMFVQNDNLGSFVFWR